MELIKRLINEFDYSDCESRIDVATIVNEALEELGVPTEDVLTEVVSELGLTYAEHLFDDFQELPDAHHYEQALSDALEFEENMGKYPSDVADSVVAIMMLQAPPELREHLENLPFRKS